MSSRDRRLIFVGIYLVMVVFFMSIANANLGTFKQNDAVSIRVLANCSSVNLTEVNDGTTTYVINSVMTNLGGQTFNYTFSNTSKIGTYTYSWNNPCVDCASSDCGNSFEITSTGDTSVDSQTGVIIAQGIFIALLVGLGFSFSKEKWKLRGFFFTLALMVGVIMIGSIRVVAGLSGTLDTLTNSAFIVGIIAVAFMVVYLLIYYTIEIFTKLKNKKEMKWQVSSNPN